MAGIKNVVLSSSAELHYPRCTLKKIKCCTKLDLKPIGSLLNMITLLKFKFLHLYCRSLNFFFFNSMAMQAIVSYQKSLVIQALRYHFISKREIKLMIIIVNVFTSVAAILFYLKKVTPVAFLISFFLWVVLMLAFWRWLPSAIYRRSPTFKESFQVSLEENHLFIENEKGGKSWAWREFSEMIETPHFFHLYFNPRSFFLLPKDGFGDSDRIHEVRVFLKSKIGK